MPATRTCIVLFVAWLAAPASLPAGLYVLREQPSLLPRLSRPSPVEFANVRSEREALRDVNYRLHEPLKPGEPPPPLKEGSRYPAYLQAVEEMEARWKEGTLDSRATVTLTGYLIRLGKFEKATSIAREALDRLPRNESTRCLLMLNLACAAQDQGTSEMLQRAIDWQQEALKSWPAIWPGWDREERDWHHRVEELTLRLLRSRLREQLRPPARDALPVDPIFGDRGKEVQFIGEGGRYEPGRIAFSQWNKLPLDAERLVIELVMAHPFDDRLYWLYGELLNARGDIPAAYQVLNGLSQQPPSSVVRSHHAVLGAVVPAATRLDEDPTIKRQLLWAFAPRGCLFSPGLGDFCHEAAWAAACLQAQQGGTSGGGMEPIQLTSGGLPNWREMIVSFTAGMVVGLLAALQWMEWRRRRREAVLVRPDLPAWSEPPSVPHSDDA